MGKSALRISFSYVLMRENLEELPEFIRLAHSLGADSVQVWPLNANSMGIERRQMTQDFLFCYKQQNVAWYPHLTDKMLKESRSLAEELGVPFGNLPSYRFDAEDGEDFPYPLSIEEFEALAKQKDLSMYGIDMGGNKSDVDIARYKKCYFPWTNFYITTDGSFAPCLHLIYKGGVGNVLEEGIQGVWNNQKMQQLRSDILEGRVNPVCRNAQCPFL